MKWLRALQGPSLTAAFVVAMGLLLLPDDVKRLPLVAFHLFFGVLAVVIVWAFSLKAFSKDPLSRSRSLLLFLLVLVGSGIALLGGWQVFFSRSIHVFVGAWAFLVGVLRISHAAKVWVVFPVALVFAWGSQHSIQDVEAGEELLVLGAEYVEPPFGMGFSKSVLTKEQAKAFVDDQRCVSCHQEQVEAHHRSAHFQASLKNPVYLQALRKDLLDEGAGRLSFCMGCHDHGVLVFQKVEEVERALLSDDWRREIALLTSSMEKKAAGSSAGLTCMSCHGGASLQSDVGNGHFVLQASDDELLDDELFTGSTLLAATMTSFDPRRHRKKMRTQTTGASARCGSCHQSFLHAGLNGNAFTPGQQERRDHRASVFYRASGASGNLPLTTSKRRCVDCHFSEERGGHEAIAANSFLPNDPRRHLALAELRRQERQEKQLSFAFFRVDESGVSFIAPDAQGRFLVEHRPDSLGGKVEVHLLLSNEGIAHDAFGGTSDLSDHWIAFDVQDDKGNVIRAEKNASTQAPFQGAHRMGTQMLDDDGNVEKEHRLSHLITPLTQHPLLPGRAHLIRYRFSCCASGQAPDGELVEMRDDDDEKSEHDDEKPARQYVRARLFTRKMAALKNESSTSNLPVYPRLLTPHDSGLDEQLAYARYVLAAATDWEDLRAQQAMTHLVASEIEGDLARTRFLIERLHHYDEAAGLLVEQNDPRALFLRAKALALGGRDEEALSILRPLTKRFYNDRDVWWLRSIAERRGGNTKKALESLRRALRIDPFFKDGWQTAVALFGEVKDKKGVAMARKRFEKVRPSREAVEIAVKREARDSFAAQEANRHHVHELVMATDASESDASEMRSEKR